MNFSTTNSLNYIRNNNSAEGTPSAIKVSAKTKSTLAVVTKKGIGPVTIQSENTFWSSDGEVGTKIKSFVSTIIEGVQVDIGGSKSILSSGENSRSADVTIKPVPGVSVPLSVSRVTSRTGSQKTEVKAGAEVKAGDKSGVKASTSITIGIND